MWCISLYQYIIILFVFNYNSTYRKKFYDNKSYILYISLILFLFTSLITNSFYDQAKKDTFINLVYNIIINF
jgi:hypothetical protein